MESSKRQWPDTSVPSSSIRDSVKRLKLASQRLKQEQPRLVFVAAETIFYANYDQFVHFSAYCPVPEEPAFCFTKCVRPSHCREAFANNDEAVLFPLGLVQEEEDGQFESLLPGAGFCQEERFMFGNLLTFLRLCRRGSSRKLVLVSYPAFAEDKLQRVLVAKLKEFGLAEVFSEQVSHIAALTPIVKDELGEIPNFRGLYSRLTGKELSPLEPLNCRSVAAAMSEMLGGDATTVTELMKMPNLESRLATVPNVGTLARSFDCVFLYKSWDTSSSTCLKLDRQYDLDWDSRFAQKDASEVVELVDMEREKSCELCFVNPDSLCPVCEVYEVRFASPVFASGQVTKHAFAQVMAPASVAAHLKFVKVVFYRGNSLGRKCMSMEVFNSDCLLLKTSNFDGRLQVIGVCQKIGGDCRLQQRQCHASVELRSQEALTVQPGQSARINLSTLCFSKMCKDDQHVVSTEGRTIVSGIKTKSSLHWLNGKSISITVENESDKAVTMGCNSLLGVARCCHNEKQALLLANVMGISFRSEVGNTEVLPWIVKSPPLVQQYAKKPNVDIEDKEYEGEIFCSATARLNPGKSMAVECRLEPVPVTFRCRVLQLELTSNSLELNVSQEHITLWRGSLNLKNGSKEIQVVEAGAKMGRIKLLLRKRDTECPNCTEKALLAAGEVRGCLLCPYYKMSMTKYSDRLGTYLAEIDWKGDLEAANGGSVVRVKVFFDNGVTHVTCPRLREVLDGRFVLFFAGQLEGARLIPGRTVGLCQIVNASDPNTVSANCGLSRPYFFTTGGALALPGCRLRMGLDTLQSARVSTQQQAAVIKSCTQLGHIQELLGNSYPIVLHTKYIPTEDVPEILFGNPTVPNLMLRLHKPKKGTQACIGYCIDQQDLAQRLLRREKFVVVKTVPSTEVPAEDKWSLQQQQDVDTDADRYAKGYLFPMSPPADLQEEEKNFNEEQDNDYSVVLSGDDEEEEAAAPKKKGSCPKVCLSDFSGNLCPKCPQYLILSLEDRRVRKGTKAFPLLCLVKGKDLDSVDDFPKQLYFFSGMQGVGGLIESTWKVMYCGNSAYCLLTLEATADIVISKAAVVAVGQRKKAGENVLPTFKVRLEGDELNLKPGESKSNVTLSPCAEVDQPCAVILSLNHGLCLQGSAIVCMGSSLLPSKVSIINKGIRAVQLSSLSVLGRADNLLMPQPFRNLMQWRAEESLEKPLFGGTWHCQLVSSATVSVLAGRTVSLPCGLSPDPGNSVHQCEIRELSLDKWIADKFEVISPSGGGWTGSLQLKNITNKIQHLGSRSILGSICFGKHLDKNMKVTLLNLQAKLEISVSPGAYFGLYCNLGGRDFGENTLVEVIKLYEVEGIKVLTESRSFVPEAQLGFMAQNVSGSVIKAGRKVNLGCVSVVKVTKNH